MRPGGEIEHEALLITDGSVDLAAVEDQERLHRCMPYTLVAVNERMVANKREAQRRGLLDPCGIQVDATEGGLGLSDGRVERTKVTDPGCAAGHLEEAAVQIDHLPGSDISHQARRRYSSSFLCRTRSAAALNSSPGVARRSATAARARSSRVSPRRSASRQRRSTWACDRSIMSFMRVLYRATGLSNNALQWTRARVARPAR